MVDRRAQGPVWTLHLTPEFSSSLCLLQEEFFLGVNLKLLAPFGCNVQLCPHSPPGLLKPGLFSGQGATIILDLDLRLRSLVLEQGVPPTVPVGCDLGHKVFTRAGSVMRRSPGAGGGGLLGSRDGLPGRPDACCRVRRNQPGRPAEI